MKKEKTLYFIVCIIVAGLLCGLIVSNNIKADDEPGKLNYRYVMPKSNPENPQGEIISESFELEVESMPVTIPEATIEITPEPVIEITPEPTPIIENTIQEEIILEEEHVEDSCFEGDIEYGTYYEDVNDVPESPYEYFGECALTWYVDDGSACANGNYPTVGYTVANNLLPFGTRVLIDGIEYVIEDRGSHETIDTEMWFDIYVGDASNSPGWGVKQADVYIIH